MLKNPTKAIDYAVPSGLRDTEKSEKPMIGTMNVSVLSLNVPAFHSSPTIPTKASSAWCSSNLSGLNAEKSEKF